MGFPATFPGTFPNGGGGATSAPAEVATGSGVAAGAVQVDTTHDAGLAGGTGQAPQPTVSTPGQANAGLASGIGDALPPSTTGAPFVAGGFNAVYWPRLRVRANFGAGLVDIGTDSVGRKCIRSFSRSLGRNTAIDSADPGACTIVFSNRSGDYDAIMGGADFPLTVGTPIVVDTEWPVGTFKARFTGTVTDVLLDVDTDPDPTVTINCGDGFEELGRTQLPQGITTFPTWYTGERIYDLADLAGWTDPRAIDTGGMRVPFNQELGSTVLDLMQQVEMTEMGLLFVSENGTLTYWDRYHHQTASRSTATQLTITDSGAASTVKAAELSRSRSRDGVYNEVLLTRDPEASQDPEISKVEPGDEPKEQFASDATSIAANGHLNLPAEVGKLHSSDAAVLDHARLMVDQYKTVQDRISSVTINMLHNKIKTENLYATLMGITLLDRIVVFRDYGPANISATLHVQRVEEEFAPEPPTWNLVLTTSNIPPTIPQFILGTSVLGTGVLGA